jgi:hypothetical protein
MLHFKNGLTYDALMPLRPVLVPLACAGLVLVGCPGSEDDSPAHNPSGNSAASSGGEGGNAGSSGEAEVAGAPLVAGEGGRGDSGGAGGAGGSAEEPDAVTRSVGLVLAAPDLPPQFVCLAAFRADAEGKPTGEPVLAGGPFGVPDRTDPTGRRLAGGFPYGSVVRLPVRARDERFFDGLVPIGFYVDDVSPREFAGSGNDSETCKRAWPEARDVAARQLPMADMQVGDSWIAGVSGCVGKSTAPECADGANLTLSHERLDLGLPTSLDGSGDLSFTLQVAHLAADSHLQGVDLYLQPMRAEGDAKVADGEPIALGEEAAGLSRGDITRTAFGVRLASETAKETLLLVVPHGKPPCLTGEACATIAVPIQPSLDRYGSPMGGATGAAWAGHQVIALFGRAPTADEAPASAIRLGIFDASLP